MGAGRFHAQWPCMNLLLAGVTSIMFSLAALPPVDEVAMDTDMKGGGAHHTEVPAPTRAQASGKLDSLRASRGGRICGNSRPGAGRPEPACPSLPRATAASRVE